MGSRESQGQIPSRQGQGAALALCSRRTSSLLASSTAGAWEMVQAGHAMTQPPLREGCGLNLGVLQLLMESNLRAPPCWMNSLNPVLGHQTIFSLSGFDEVRHLTMVIKPIA